MFFCSSRTVYRTCMLNSPGGECCPILISIIFNLHKQKQHKNHAEADGLTPMKIQGMAARIASMPCILPPQAVV